LREGRGGVVCRGTTHVAFLAILAWEGFRASEDDSDYGGLTGSFGQGRAMLGIELRKSKSICGV